MDGAMVGESRSLAALERTQFLAGVLQMIGMDEIGPAAPDHLIRPIAEDGFAAWTDLHDLVRGAHDHDQVLRGVEDLPPLLELLLQRPLGSPGLGEAAGDL